jgi:hypothetical protein
MPRLMSVWLVLLGLLLAAPAPVWAGGDGYDEVDEAEGAGTIFYGVVRDTRGLGMTDVTVTLRPKSGEAVVLKTNILGLYRGHMSKDILPEDIEVICAKPGYTLHDSVRRQALNNNILVETNCTLQKQTP